MSSDELQSKIARVLEVVGADLATVRTGKASPVIIENLPIDVYGTRMKLVELATLSASDPATLIVTPFDIGNGDEIAKAIQNAGLGLTAIVEDTKIRVMVPQLSAERRQEYVKLVRAKVEGGKVMVRQARHEAMEEAAKAEIDEDSRVRLEKEIQAEVDRAVGELEAMADEKAKELLTI